MKTIFDTPVLVMTVALLAMAPVHSLAAAGDEASKGPMAAIKGGCFDMGDTFDGIAEDNKPVHRVCVDDFKIDKYEVTFAAFKTVNKTKKFSSSAEKCANCPVSGVSWFEAQEYCQALGKRLPTEAEWEYAAREGGKKVMYGTGKNDVDLKSVNYNAIMDVKSPAEAAKIPFPAVKLVGSYPPNALGLYDMSGNIGEWTADWYAEDYYKKSQEKNPKGPSSGEKKVVRGGTWDNYKTGLEAASRANYSPKSGGIATLGVRCAQ